MKIVYVRPNKDAWGYKPLGLSLLIALEKRKGNEVHLFDTTRYDFNVLDNNTAGTKAGIFKPVNMNDYHKKIKSDYIEDFEMFLNGIYPEEVRFTVMSDQVDVASQLSKVAAGYTNKITWGGAHPTMDPKGCPSFVKVHQGEAIKSIYGIKKLDDLAYADWDEYDDGNFWRPYNGKAYRAGDHMLNWGCPYSCSYCINSTHKHKIQRYGTSRIIDELEHLKKRHRLNFFKFHDEDFLFRPVENLKELAKQYSGRIGLPFVIETNPRTVTEEKAMIVKDMGCVSVSMGIETGNEELRSKVLNRADSIEDVLRAFHIFNKIGVRTSSFNMLGIPFETQETYENTIELNKRAEVKAPYADFFYPFVGTPLRDIAIENGFFNPADSELYRRDRPALNFPGLDLIAMKNEFVERIHHANL